jgi:hypothetical protein
VSLRCPCCHQQEQSWACCSCSSGLAWCCLWVTDQHDVAAAAAAAGAPHCEVAVGLWAPVSCQRPLQAADSAAATAAAAAAAAAGEGLACWRLQSRCWFCQPGHLTRCWIAHLTRCTPETAGCCAGVNAACCQAGCLPRRCIHPMVTALLYCRSPVTWH